MNELYWALLTIIVVWIFSFIYVCLTSNKVEKLHDLTDEEFIKFYNKTKSYTDGFVYLPQDIVRLIRLVNEGKITE